MELLGRFVLVHIVQRCVGLGFGIYHPFALSAACVFLIIWYLPLRMPNGLDKPRRQSQTDLFDLEPVLIQPAYIQCAEPSDEEIVRVLRDVGND